jgi:peptidoglycan/LPS O-acetylase OafA/YrhL
VVAFAWIALASCAAYVSMLSLVGPLHWTTVGPFTFQTSRLLHYAVYFAAGVLVGARGIDGSWLAEGGALARRAPWWTAAAIAAFLVLTVLVVITPATAPTWQSLATGVVFALSCAASSFALLSLFLRAGRSQSLAWRGLRDAAYGIYLVHFAIAAWVQYALVGWSADALVKGAIAFAVTLALSWMLASAVRRIPGFASVL